MKFKRCMLSVLSAFLMISCIVPTYAQAYSAFLSEEATLAEDIAQGAVTVEFLYNRAELTDPAKITAKSGSVIVLPSVNIESDGKKLVKWFCEADSKYYNLGASYTVPNKNVSFIGYWEKLETTIEPIKINYADYTGGIMNRVDTGTTEIVTFEGNPGEVYDSIEIASYGHVISAKSNNTFENLCIMYAGGHGITASTCTNLIIRNCEIGWIGGTSQYIKDGKNTRYGNGIQIYGGCDNFVIDKCYVYECYDAGISPQYSNVGTNEVLLKNIYYTNNVIDKCIYNIEYFVGKTVSGTAERYFDTMYYVGNILARSGEGWGMSPERSACIKGWDHYNKAFDFIIKDNIIFAPAYNAYHIGVDFDGWLPKFSGNTYILRRNSQFVKYGANGSTQYTFDSTAEQTAKNVLLETDFELYYLPEGYVTPKK